MKLSEAKAKFKQFKRLNESRWLERAPGGKIVYSATGAALPATVGWVPNDEDLDAEDWVGRDEPEIAITRSVFAWAYFGSPGANRGYPENDPVFEETWRRIQQRARLLEKPV